MSEVDIELRRTENKHPYTAEGLQVGGSRVSEKMR